VTDVANGDNYQYSYCEHQRDIPAQGSLLIIKQKQKRNIGNPEIIAIEIPGF